MDHRGAGEGERRPGRHRVLPADGRRRGDRGGGRDPRPRREARGGPDRGAVRGPLAGRAPGRAPGQPATAGIGRGTPLARRRRVPAPNGPADLAVLRDVRQSRRPRPAARQLPGRPAPRRRPPDVADEHRDVPPGDGHRTRLRVGRDARDGRPARGDAGVHREPRALPRAPLQLVRHARPAPARARVRLVGRQRQPRRPPPHPVERVPADDRPAAPDRGGARRDRRRHGPGSRRGRRDRRRPAQPDGHQTPAGRGIRAAGRGERCRPVDARGVGGPPGGPLRACGDARGRRRGAYGRARRGTRQRARGLGRGDATGRGESRP